MDQDWRRQVSHPERLEPLEGAVDLGRPVIHAGAFDVAAGIIVETIANPWAYAISFPLDPDGRHAGARILVAVTASVSAGKIGILGLDQTGRHREVFFDTADGRATGLIEVPCLAPGCALVVRNAERPTVSRAVIHRIEVFSGFDGAFRADPDYRLQRVTQAPFQPKAERSSPFVMDAITTTEVCNLTCVMCHFNGPKAVKKARTLTPEDVRKVLRQLPPGTEMWFAGTGDLFMDPYAVDHLRAAVELGHTPKVLSHGQLYSPELLDRLLEIGVRTFRISADAIDEHQYRKIRRGGELSRILEACAHLAGRRARYPNLLVEVACTLFAKTVARQQEFTRFWSDKVDRVIFHAEYYNTFYFRNVLHQPRRRVNCRLATFILPSGHIAPCCALVVHQHTGDAGWLPHIDTHTLKEAYDQLCDMYDDAESPLGRLCRKCDWWILWAANERDNGTAYSRWVDFPRSEPADPA